MTPFLYKKISYFLFNLSVLFVLTGVYLNEIQQSFFLEWVLGSGSVMFSMTFFLDSFSCFFLSTVTFIAANVVMYSESYMSEDIFADRFIILVFSFVISMILLIISCNIVSLLLGWDGLGLVSYCLVIYYPTKKSSSAGMLTVMSNRVGDVCILLSIGIFGIMGEFNFLVWVDYNFTDKEALFFLLTLAAMTKSAQIPFSAWLPAAMAAPTPVSALVHSSTLVTAGVYLLFRFSSFISELNSSFLLFISVVTLLMAGMVAVFEYDMKKIIALSTLSQLGVMMFAISLGLYKIAFFHLVAHALFKALLFLSAGAYIHGMAGNQDMRLFGGLTQVFPNITVCMNLANLSLCGMPFLSGFYSKDMIVEMAVQSLWNQFMISLFYLGLGLTVIYSVRLTFYTLVVNPMSSLNYSSCDEDPLLTYPIYILTLTALISGPLFSEILFISPTLVFLPFLLKMATWFVIITSILISFIWVNSETLNLTQFSVFNFFQGNMWSLPFLSGLISKFPLSVGNEVLKNYDYGWFEWSSILTLKNQVQNFNMNSYLLQSNILKFHLLTFLVVLFFFLIIF
nr:NADH dehydrogenase subunit 5 [Eurycercus lamellatus]